MLYRLPEILAKSVVYVVEGEKDADRLWSLGIPATTSPMGAKNWRSEYAHSLKDKQVVIVPDNDPDGRRYAQDVSRSLVDVATAVKIVRLPGLAEHGDVSDWLDAGGRKEALLKMIERTPWGTDSGRPLPTAPPADGHGGMRFDRLGDLLAEQEEEKPYLVDGLLPASGISLLAGKPKAGKSTLARCLAFAVARGEGFLGRATIKGSVLYLALEEKRSEVKRHFQDMGATGKEEIYIYAARAPADGITLLHAAAEQRKPALIIVDPLFRLARVKDGNDYAQVTQALEPLLALARETGAHVLCVHHMGKGERQGGDAILGSTAILSTVDTALLLKRTECYRTLGSIQRYGEDMEETVLHFDTATRTVILGETKGQEEESRIGGEILDFLSGQTEPVTEKDIDAGVEGKTQRKRYALRALVKEGKVSRHGKGGPADPYRYSPVPSVPSVPTYSGEQGNKMPENGVSPQKDGGSLCSRDVAPFEEQGTEREQGPGPSEPVETPRKNEWEDL